MLEVQNARARLKRRFVFYGKTQVYSAGVTLMSGFPKGDRYLSHDAVLLIHCRQLDQTIEISGPIRASLPKLDAVRHQIEVGVALENENFKRLIKGSDIGFDELIEKAEHNWYLPAQEAFDRGLVAGIISCQKAPESEWLSAALPRQTGSSVYRIEEDGLGCTAHAGAHTADN